MVNLKYCQFESGANAILTIENKFITTIKECVSFLFPNFNDHLKILLRLRFTASQRYCSPGRLEINFLYLKSTSIPCCLKKFWENNFLEAIWPAESENRVESHTMYCQSKVRPNDPYKAMVRKLWCGHYDSKKLAAYAREPDQLF